MNTRNRTTMRHLRSRSAVAATAALVTGGTLILPAVQASASPAKATVRMAAVAGGRLVLVDAAGHTLYAFAPDKRKRATCTGACAAVWPPLLARGKLVAGAGSTSSLVGKVKDADGRFQITYNRWPLYTFVGDGAPGQAHGQGITSFGGKWSVLGASGKAFVARSSTAATPTTSQGRGYGY